MIKATTFEKANLHQHFGSWYFYDETGNCDGNGPFATFDEALKGLREYVRSLEQDNEAS